MSNVPVIGFISPPGWIDPTPAEFTGLFESPVVAQQCPLHMPGLDWQIESLSRCEPALVQAAVTLAEMGCDLIACVGTPFAWAGLTSAEEARQRQQRLIDRVKVPVLFSALSMFNTFDRLGVRRVALACTYYSDHWRNCWMDFVEASGYRVCVAENFICQGIYAPHDDADKSHWAPTAEQILQSIHYISASAPDADVIAISGAGARTLKVQPHFRKVTDIPIVAADTALYQDIGAHLGLIVKA